MSASEQKPFEEAANETEMQSAADFAELDMPEQVSEANTEAAAEANPETPAEDPDALLEAGDSGYPARRHNKRGDRRGRGGRAFPMQSTSAAPESEITEAPEPAEPTPVAETPVVTPSATDETQPDYDNNTSGGADNAVAKILGSLKPNVPQQTAPRAGKPVSGDVIANAIAEHEAKQNGTSVDPTKRPDVYGPVQSHRVQLAHTPRSSRIAPEVKTPKAAEPETPEPAATTSSEDGDFDYLYATDTTTPTANNRGSDFDRLFNSAVANQNAANQSSANRTGGDLFTQLGYDTTPAITDRANLRGAGRTALESSGAEIPGSQELRSQTNTGAKETATPAVVNTAEPAGEPAPYRGRHRRGTPASFGQQIMGYTSKKPESALNTPNNPDVTETQPIPALTTMSGEAAPAEPERHGVRQRIRNRIGRLATGATTRLSAGREHMAQRWETRENDLSGGLQSGEALSLTEEGRSQPTNTNLRRRMIGALGLAAASAGLISGISGEIAANESRHQAPISASQLPGQSAQEGLPISAGAFNRANEYISDQVDRAGQIRQPEHAKDKEIQKPSVSDAGREKITTNGDGSVTVELREGGNYWEGIRHAEEMLKIDDSSTATANAVNTIDFEKGEDRSQKVGAKITFKNVNGKLVAARS